MEPTDYDLLAMTRLMWERRQLSMNQISIRSGVGFPWLVKWHKGDIPAAGIVILQKLHDFLLEDERHRYRIREPFGGKSCQ